MLEGHGTQGYIVSRLSVVQAHTFHAGEYKCSPLTDKTHSVYVIGGKTVQGYKDCCSSVILAIVLYS